MLAHPDRSNMVTLERVVAISIDGSKQKPSYAGIESVDGVEVIKVSKKELGFQRFVTEGLDNNGAHANMTWLDELKVLRQKASLALNNDTQESSNSASLFGAATPSKAQT